MTLREIEHRNRRFWVHDETEHTEWVLSVLDKWEPDTYDAIERFCQGGVFVDIGAWIGLFTIWAAPLCAHVYAVEPDPAARDMLERNITANNLDNVTVIPQAIWSHNGYLTLHENTGLGDSMTGPRRGGTGHRYECITPDTLRYMVGENVDLVKLDTEGAESDILPGVIRWPAPLHVSVHIDQIDGQELSFGDRPAEILPGGTKNNYTVLVL